MGGSLLTRLALEIPRGEDGFWAIIQELDAAGAWSIADVDKRSNVARGTVSGYCKRLRLGGYIAPTAKRDHPLDQFGPATLYRIARPAVLPPRLKADGSPRPEPLIETVWRTIKMSRDFTAREIVVEIAAGGAAPKLNTVRSYLGELARVGVIARTDGGIKAGKRGGGTVEARYRLKRNLGAMAPKLLASKVVYDPNANQVLGTAVAAEVRP